MSRGADGSAQDKERERKIYDRLRAFTIALTGSMRAGAGLAKAALANLNGTEAAAMDKDAVVMRAYQEAHALWVRKMAQMSAGSSGRGDPRCFAIPGHTPEAAARHKGLAQVIADLPALQRATLLLIYGEGLSYDEVAEVFDVSVQDVMTRAARGHIAVGHWLDRVDGRMDSPAAAAQAETAGNSGERAA